MEYIKKINIPLTLFVILSLRSLFVYDFAQAAALFCVTGFYAYNLYLKSKVVPPLDKQVMEELDRIKQVVSGLAIKNGFKPAVPPQPTDQPKKKYF